MSPLKKLTKVILCLAVIAPAMLKAQGPATLVVTDQVKEQKFHDQVSLVGRTQAVIESRIVAEVSGRVARINMPEGNQVKANQTLITIDGQQIELTLKAKSAEASQAKIRYDLAKAQLKRTQELFNQSLISETTLDSALAWAEIQKANYELLDAERQKLQLDFDNTKIKAPYSGYTGRQLTNVGEWVTPGMPVYEMVDLSSVKITADLPERYFGHLQRGSEAYITISNGSTNLVTGRVTGISPNASQETHTYPVIIEVDNSEGKIGGGMLVRVTLSLNEEFQSLAVSKDAIVRQGNQTLVYTINEGKAAPIPVAIKSTSGEMLAVESQMLKAGMLVVIRGNERIYPGAAVTTGEETEQPAAQAETEG